MFNLSGNRLCVVQEIGWDTTSTQVSPQIHSIPARTLL